MSFGASVLSTRGVVIGLRYEHPRHSGDCPAWVAVRVTISAIQVDGDANPRAAIDAVALPGQRQQ